MLLPLSFKILLPYKKNLVLFLQQRPHFALQSWIDYYFMMHIDHDRHAAPILSPFPPTPLQFIVFYLDDEALTQKEGEAATKKRARCIVVGPQATRMNLLIRGSHRCFVIAFRPGGLYRMLHIPMKELYDDGFEGRDVIGGAMSSLTEALQEAGSFDQMVVTAEKFLLQKNNIIESTPFDSAMQVLLQYNGLISIDRIASLSCLSVRQFERKCIERIGLSPKFYARLARFSKAYRLRESRPGMSWTAVAHESGYYDQMHFIRDFRQFAGLTPSVMGQFMKANPFPMQAPLQL